MGESERYVPKELKTLSSAEFGFPHSSGTTVSFSLRRLPATAKAWFVSTTRACLQPHRPARPSYLPRLPAHRSDDSDARRRQAARGDSEAVGHRHAAAIPDSAHSIWRGRDRPRLVLRQPPGACPRWLYLRLRRHSRPLQERGTVCDERPLADHRDPKAVDESTDAYDTVAWLLARRSGQQWPRRRCGHQLSTDSWP